MKFYIAKIVKQNGASLDIQGVEALEGLSELEDFTNGYTFSKTVSVEGVLTNIGEHINMNVVAKVDWNAECSRCLAPVQGNVVVTVNENFHQVKNPDEVDLDPDGYTYEGDWLVVDRAVADEIISSLPIAQLCKEDCKGLCADCGADLNLKTCDCSSNKINPAMESLKNFKV